MAGPPPRCPVRAALTRGAHPSVRPAARARTGTISAGCARFWRARREGESQAGGGGGGPPSVFEGLRATFWGKNDEKKELTVILNEGGATVVPTNSFNRAMTDGHDEGFNAEENPVDVVIVPRDREPREQALAKLAAYLGQNQQAVFAAVSPDFVFDWIAKPEESIREHVLLTKASAAGVHGHLYEDIGGSIFPRQLVEKANLCRGCAF